MVTEFFYLAALTVSLLSSNRSSTLHQGTGLSVFIHQDSLSSWMCKALHQIWEVSPNAVFCTFLSPSETPNVLCLSLRLCTFFSFSDWILSVGLSSDSLTLFTSIPKLLLSPSGEFFISGMVVFKSRIPISTFQFGIHLHLFAKKLQRQYTEFLYMLHLASPKVSILHNHDKLVKRK